MKALLLALPLLMVPSSVAADCERTEVEWYNPTGYEGCANYGIGKASRWPGPGVAVNSCLYPWTDCQMIAIRSLQTGVTIVVVPTMFCDCWTGTPDEKLVDLDPGALQALGLDWEAGVYEVEVHPVGEGELGEPVPPVQALPDTSLLAGPVSARSTEYNGITEDESVDAIESRGPGRRTHPTFGRGFALLEDESR